MSDAVKPPEALPYLPLFMDLTGRPVLGYRRGGCQRHRSTSPQTFAADLARRPRGGRHRRRARSRP